MNNIRRKKLNNIAEKIADLRAELEELQEEEQEACDTKAEYFPDCPQVEQMEEAICNIENAVSSLDDAISSLEEATI